MDASTRSSLDPSLIPTLTANIEQEGMLRYDRGEQLLERIRDKTVLRRLPWCTFSYALACIYLCQTLT